MCQLLVFWLLCNSVPGRCTRCTTTAAPLRKRTMPRGAEAPFARVAVVEEVSAGETFVRESESSSSESESHHRRCRQKRERRHFLRSDSRRTRCSSLPKELKKHIFIQLCHTNKRKPKNREGRKWSLSQSHGSLIAPCSWNRMHTEVEVFMENGVRGRARTAGANSRRGATKKCKISRDLFSIILHS